MGAMEKIIACQISYLPLRTDRIGERVEKILSVVRNSELECSIGVFATDIKGRKPQVFSLIREIFEVAETEGQFVLEVKLSNICGCE